MMAVKNGRIWKFQKQITEFGLNTVLFLRLETGNAKIVKLLVENNVTNVNAKDKDGYTALDAVNTAAEGNLKIIHYNKELMVVSGEGGIPENYTKLLWKSYQA